MELKNIELINFRNYKYQKIEFINGINSPEIKAYYEYLKESLTEDNTYPIYFTDIFDEFTPDTVSQITKKQMMLEM